MDLSETDDLARHDGLEEEGLNEALKQRFINDRIYTYVGDILIAVNPYAKLSLYNEVDSKRYTNVASKADFPPHLYAIADAAYAEMNRNSKPQVSDNV